MEIATKEKAVYSRLTHPFAPERRRAIMISCGGEDNGEPGAQQLSVARRLPWVRTARMAGFFMHNGLHSGKICRHQPSIPRYRIRQHGSIFKTHCFHAGCTK